MAPRVTFIDKWGVLGGGNAVVGDPQFEPVLAMTAETEVL